MPHPDKELWDRINFDPERYEYIPIPDEVARIIVRKKGDRVLLAHFCITEKKEKVLMLHYVVENNGSLMQAPGGYCSDSYTDVKVKLIQIAKDIAADYPIYRVSKHKKKVYEQNK